MMNRVFLVGYLVRDPEPRNSDAGNTVCTFTVIVDNKMKNPDGTRGVTFVPCVCFQQTADNVVKYTKKNSLVGVEGRLVQRSFKRKDGSNGSSMEVICDTVKFLDRKSSDDKEDEGVTFDDEPATEEETNKNLDSIDVPLDDLPF